LINISLKFNIKVRSLSSYPFKIKNFIYLDKTQTVNTVTTTTTTATTSRLSLERNKKQYKELDELTKDPVKAWEYLKQTIPTVEKRLSFLKRQVEKLENENEEIQKYKRSKNI